MLRLGGLGMLLAITSQGHGVLYARARGTALHQDPKSSSRALTTLKQGAEVTWLSTDSTARGMLTVSVDGKQGFISRGELTPFKAVEEIATDGPGSAPGKSGWVRKGEDESAIQLSHVEELNSRVTEAAMQEHCVKAGLVPK